MGWAQMIEKTSGLALPLRASASNLDLHWALPASLSSLVGCVGWQGVSLVKGKVWRRADLDSNPSSFTS